MPYSPKFNGIESYFSNLKLYYKKFLLMKVTKKENVDPEQLIEESLLQVKKETAVRCSQYGLK